MSPKHDLEDAITEASGEAAVMTVLRDAFLTHDGQQWEKAGATPIEGSAVAVFTIDEWRALGHTLLRLIVAVEKVDEAFYAASKAGAL